MNSNEQYIENLISQGYHPLDALVSLIRSYEPHSMPTWDLERDEFINYPKGHLTLFERILDSRQIHLSDPFIYKWFKYPYTKLPRTPMLFAGQLPSVNLSNKLVLTENSLNSTKVNVQTYIQEPLYIPVIRYVSPQGIGIFQSSEMTNEYCGNYYYYEPDSDVYLLSNLTMIAPQPDLAYYVLLGGNQEAFEKILREKFPVRYNEFRSYYFNWFNKILDAWKNGKLIDTTEEFEFVDEMKTNIEQKLCFLAKQFRIDVIIFTYSTTNNPRQTDKYLDEILDTRSRELSYGSLYRSS